MTAHRSHMDFQMSLDGIENLGELFDRRSRAADSCMNTFDLRHRVRYGEGQNEMLNIFPAGSDAPVMIFIHGGFWKSLTADLFSFLAPGFVPFGAALVVIDYPLMPSCRMSDIIESCEKAVRWVHQNAASFGGDPDRIFISGNSAGGHLVAECMRRPVVDVIRGGTAISGLFDLQPVTMSFQNDDLQLTPNEVANFSPLGCPVEIDAPMIVAVGGEETEEFQRQSRAYAAHVGTDVLSAPGQNHITIVLDGLAGSNSELNRRVRDQMGLQRFGL